MSKMNSIPRPFLVLSFACLALSQWRWAGGISQRGPTWLGMLQWVIYTEVRQWVEDGRPTWPSSPYPYTVLCEVGNLHGGPSPSTARKGGRCPADLAVFTVLNTVGNLHGGIPGSIRVNIITQM